MVEGLKINLRGGSVANWRKNDLNCWFFWLNWRHTFIPPLICKFWRTAERPTTSLQSCPKIMDQIWFEQKIYVISIISFNFLNLILHKNLLNRSHIHNVEILRFFCHSDFTWNQIWQFWGLKIWFLNLLVTKNCQNLGIFTTFRIQLWNFLQNYNARPYNWQFLIP